LKFNKIVVHLYDRYTTKTPYDFTKIDIFWRRAKGREWMRVRMGEVGSRQDF
jgi:hypothetical protein